MIRHGRRPRDAQRVSGLATLSRTSPRDDRSLLQAKVGKPLGLSISRDSRHVRPTRHRPSFKAGTRVPVSMQVASRCWTRVGDCLNDMAERQGTSSTATREGRAAPYAMAIDQLDSRQPGSPGAVFNSGRICYAKLSDGSLSFEGVYPTCGNARRPVQTQSRYMSHGPAGCMSIQRNCAGVSQYALESYAS